MKKNQIVYITLLIYIILLALENTHHLSHWTNFLLGNYHYYSIPLPKNILDSIPKLVKNINNYQDYTFIDFGSGYGNILLEYNNLFKKLIGVELNKTSHDQAKLVLNNYKNISLYNTSMEKYKFPNEKIILYMYEPLFELKCKDRDKIYKDVINNLYNNNNKSYIIYIRETTISNVIDNCYYNEDYFKNKFKLISKCKLGLFPLTREIYFLESLN